MARLHEYQGKDILAANGFKISHGRVAATADEAVAAAKGLARQEQRRSRDQDSSLDYQAGPHRRSGLR
jgi:hypothetical protein